MKSIGHIGLRVASCIPQPRSPVYKVKVVGVWILACVNNNMSCSSSYRREKRRNMTPHTNNPYHLLSHHEYKGMHTKYLVYTQRIIDNRDSSCYTSQHWPLLSQG